MNGTFDLHTEQELIGSYLAHLPQPRAERQGGLIGRICDDFRQFRPGESILAQAHTTEWILPWLEGPGVQLRPAARSSHVEALGRWWGWLFQHSLLDDNVLDCFYPCSQVLRHKAPLVLCQNLQRPIACYLEERGPRQPQQRRKIRRLLTNFNVFLHRSGTEPTDRAPIDERRTIDWLRQLGATRSLHSLALAAAATHGFLRFLVDKHHLDENPLLRLRSQYSAPRWDDFLAGLLGLQGASLVPAVHRPRFVSALAPQLAAFVDLKRALGRRYQAAVTELQRFDRFLASCCGQSTTITQQTVDAWSNRMGHLKPCTRKKRMGLVRQFCLYLARQDPLAYVPEPARVNVRTPQFTPHIYTVAEFRRLLEAARQLPVRRSALRPRAAYTVLLILYGTGLRIGEALRLRLRDIDLETDTLMIRDTKFYKSRVVPITVSLREEIRDYLDERLKATASPDAFLFLNHRGDRYSSDKFSEIFRDLLVTAKVPWRYGHRPRVHDIRHTFAHNCVLRWYREGADLQAKLPLLATYLGHVSVLSTQEYLKATPELLRQASARFESSYGTVIDDHNNGENR